MESEKIRIYVFNIFIIFIAVISILIFIDFTKNTQLLNFRTVEALTDLGEIVLDNTTNNDAGDISVDLARDFCKSHAGSSNTLVEACGKLTNQNCNSTSCCVMLNGKKCVPGDIDGPTFKTSDGKPIQIDYYYYQNKKIPSTK